MWWIAFGVAPWSAGRGSIAWCVVFGVDSAADGFGAVVVGAGFVGEVDVGVAKVDDFDGILATWWWPHG